MEYPILFFRDGYDAARITGVNCRELKQAGVPLDGLICGFASPTNISPGWKPGEEFTESHNNGNRQAPAALPMFELLKDGGRVLRHSVFGKWHFYTVQDRFKMEKQ